MAYLKIKKIKKIFKRMYNKYKEKYNEKYIFNNNNFFNTNSNNK